MTMFEHLWLFFFVCDWTQHSQIKYHTEYTFLGPEVILMLQIDLYPKSIAMAPRIQSLRSRQSVM